MSRSTVDSRSGAPGDEAEAEPVTAPAHSRRRRRRQARRQHRSPRSTAATLLHGASWSTAAQLAPVAVNLVLTPFLIRHLGVDQYGLYALAATISVFLGSFNGGISQSAQRFFSVFAGRNDRAGATRLLCTLLVLLVVLGGVLSAGCWFAAPLLARAFHMPGRYRPETVFLLRTLGLLITAGFLHGLFVSLLQGWHRFSVTSQAVIVAYGAWAAGVYVALERGYGLRGVAVAMVAQQVLAALVAVPAALRYTQWRGVGFLPWPEVKEFIGFSARVQASSIASLVNNEVDALVIGAVLPVRNVGMYNSGSNFAFQLRSVATNGLGPIATHLSQVFATGGEKAAEDEMRRVQRAWVLFTTGWCAAGMGAVYFGVVAWLGPQFRLAAVIGAILLGGHAVNLYTGVMSMYAGAVGKPGIETRYGVVGMVVNVVLTVPLVFLGALGVVAATAVGQAIGSAYLVRVARRRLSPDLPSFFADIPVAAAAVGAGVTVALEALIEPVVPYGAAGLVLCGFPALAGMAAYALVVLGPRRSLRIARTLAAGRSPLEALAS